MSKRKKPDKKYYGAKAKSEAKAYSVQVRGTNKALDVARLFFF